MNCCRVSLEYKGASVPQMAVSAWWPAAAWDAAALAPVIMINEDVYGSLTGEELDAILAKYP